MTFLAGVKAPDKFRACARIGINHSYGLMYRFNNLLPAVKQVAGRDGVDRLAYMKPAGRSLPITPHHNSGVTWFTDTKIPQYRISAVVRMYIQAVKPGRRIYYDVGTISLNNRKINSLAFDGSLFALINQNY
ncbi:hypothetical protein AML45_05285 [Escherichia coli]|nr:hypothetical protein BX12_21725 [Escherichia coli O69:H11 str. 2009C-3601]KYT57763.1 hypothetical protein AML45_05285 [Escherichia coli]